MKKINCFDGLKDRYGVNLNYKVYLSFLLSDLARKFGYSQIEMPIIENSFSFSEEVVGKSPWPEWNEKGCFYLKIKDYKNTFDKKINENIGILIPEGTISVTRWLGSIIDDKRIKFPLKIFYNTPCFRNELMDSLSTIKQRQFNQFGVEILGSSSIIADIEVLYLIYEMLNSLGIKKELIKIRCSNIAIFNLLIEQSRISKTDTLLLKGYLDTFAGCKAGKKSELKKNTKNQINTILAKYDLGRLKISWEKIITHDNGFIDQEFYELFDERFHSLFDELNDIQKTFNNQSINYWIDLCVVRSHEYYTGISFEIDIVQDEKTFFEVAGGGRYDKLVGKFMENTSDKVIPSVGFAFGVERLIEVLKSIIVFEEEKEIRSTFWFEKRVHHDIILDKETPEFYLEKIKELKRENIQFYNIKINEK